MGIVITVMSGAEDGKTFELSKTQFMLGRHPDDDVCLPYDTRVSRHHARIAKEGGSYFIEDVGPEGKGSTNGTYINDSDKKIAGKTRVSSGDTVLLGSVWVRLETN
jgi:pSer/pThr/pTyr-binding forkhead associated (FHA) protein